MKHDARRRRRGKAFVESLFPGVERSGKFGKLETVMFVWIEREILRCAREKRSAPGQISARVVIKRDRDLDKSLEEFAISRRSLAPNIFQDLVRQKILTLMKKVDAFAATGGQRWRNRRQSEISRSYDARGRAENQAHALGDGHHKASAKKVSSVNDLLVSNTPS